jgi:hypothetical protein
MRQHERCFAQIRVIGAQPTEARIIWLEANIASLCTFLIQLSVSMYQCVDASVLSERLEAVDLFRFAMSRCQPAQGCYRLSFVSVHSLCSCAVPVGSLSVLASLCICSICLSTKQ